MSIFTGIPSFGVVHNPLIDSPYTEQLDSGVGSTPVRNVLLETDNTPLLLTDGSYLNLA